MKNYLSCFLAMLLIPAIPGASKPGNNSPSGLMVEFIREPGKVPILDLKPEFSWVVPSSARKQYAYQILVATSEDKLEKNIADIWDSKKVITENSVEIEYEGEKLAPNSTYFWKVRIWNYMSNPCSWSMVQSFKTGNPEGYATTRNKFLSKLTMPEYMIKVADNHYFADFGKDAFGTLLLEFNPASDDTIIVHLGEKTSETNKIDRKPEGSIRYQRVALPVKKGTGRYLLNLRKDERNTGAAAIQLPDSFGIITPFRYCEIENCSSDLKPENIFQKAYCYFFDDESSYFTSSDTILNKVWDISKYSIKATSFAGIYVDGDRERIPYEADALINQLGHYTTDREYSLARLTNEYFINHPTWPTEWILQTVPLFYNDYMYTGNIESLRTYYDALKHKTLISLARSDGLISSKNCTDEIMSQLGFANAKERLRDIVDWPPAQKDTGWKLATPEGERDGYEMVDINTVVNAFYYHGLVLMSELAGRLGRNNDLIFFMDQAIKVRNSINNKLLSKTTGIYFDGESSQHSSLHANMTALAFGLVPEENKKAVIDFIKSRGMACSVYGAQYLLEGLYSAGEGDYAMGLLTAINDRSWWNMIKSGSTITMEAWDMKYKPNSDLNHAWGAAPANIIPRFMWGIAPVEPGYAEAIVKPMLSSLKSSKITVPTIRGNIEAEYKQAGNSGEYYITIPGNMKCSFALADNRDSLVSINGKKCGPGEIRAELKPGQNKILIMKSAKK